MYVRTSVRMYVCTYISTYVCMYVHMYVHVLCVLCTRAQCLVWYKLLVYTIHTGVCSCVNQPNLTTMHLTGQLASISILGLPSKQSKFVVYLTSTPTENVMQEVHFVRFFPKRPHVIASFSALFSLTLIFFSLPLLVYLRIS